MTRVDFYVNVPDRAAFACTIAGKAVAAGNRALVLTADANETVRVDRMMWCQPALAFVPHVRAHHRLAPETPVIVDHVTDPLPVDELLVNLTDEVPGPFARFARLIEIVSTDESDRQRARLRWRHYSERGYPLQSHDMAVHAAAAPRARRAASRPVDDPSR
ncbi:MAG: DNA polymerase III subunit chi [Pseudomonadota bacterium]|jgi:DNA polymerase-3 subunit chi